MKHLILSILTLCSLPLFGEDTSANLDNTPIINLISAGTIDESLISIDSESSLTQSHKWVNDRSIKTLYFSTTGSNSALYFKLPDDETAYTITIECGWEQDPSYLADFKRLELPLICGITDAPGSFDALETSSQIAPWAEIHSYTFNFTSKGGWAFLMLGEPGYEESPHGLCIKSIYLSPSTNSAVPLLFQNADTSNHTYYTLDGRPATISTRGLVIDATTRKILYLR